MGRDGRIGRPWRENPFLRRVALVYLGIWGLAAIAPHDRGDWLLENLVVFVAAAALVVSHRWFAFSNLSYLAVAIFGALHALGAHYTYSLTPPGFWVQEALGLERNHYDRFVHLTSGLLLTYPLRELVRRRLHVRGAASFALPVAILLAISASYEIVEYAAARIVDPDLGTAFLGTQGDEWDAQKDMSLALLGACVAMAGTALYRTRTGHEPWTLVAPRSADDSD